MALSRPCLILSAFYSILFGIQVICTSIILAEIQAQKDYLLQQQYKYYKFTSTKGQQEIINNYFSRLQTYSIIALILSSLMFLFMIIKLISTLLGKGFCQDNIDSVDSLTQWGVLSNLILLGLHISILVSSYKSGSFFNTKIKGTSISLLTTSAISVFASFGLFMKYGSTGGWEVVEWLVSPNLWFYQNMRRRKSSRRN